MGVTIEIPIDLSEQELAEVRQELAVMLYARQAASLGKAAKIAGLTRLQFQRLLAARQVAINYSAADLEADLDTLGALRPNAARR